MQSSSSELEATLQLRILYRIYCRYGERPLATYTLISSYPASCLASFGWFCFRFFHRFDFGRRIAVEKEMRKSPAVMYQQAKNGV